MARLIALGGFNQTCKGGKIEITTQDVGRDVLSEFQGKGMYQFGVIAGRRTVDARNQLIQCVLMFCKTMGKVCDTF